MTLLYDGLKPVLVKAPLYYAIPKVCGWKVPLRRRAVKIIHLFFEAITSRRQLLLGTPFIIEYCEYPVFEDLTHPPVE